MAKYIIETTEMQDTLIDLFRGEGEAREFVGLCFDMGFTAALAEYTDVRQAMLGRYLARSTKGFKGMTGAMKLLPVQEAAEEVTEPRED